MSNPKKYGLILSDKTKTTQPTFQASRNVFGNDTDSDDETNKKGVLLRPSDNIKRQAKMSQEKAILEDPTVYQYDEIFDDMVSKKEEKKTKTLEVKKPKYIEKLMKSANKRKIENERRIERQIQKERENEGDEFADKEVFVTSAYKKKLEEMKLEEEKEKREEFLESIGDVTKQRDLGGFYRHLYEQKLGTDREEVDSKEENKQTITTDKSTLKEKQETKRNYRKRKMTDNKVHLSEGEIEDSDEEIIRVNLQDIKTAKLLKSNEENIDADSDFSIDESSDEGDVVKKDENVNTDETIFKVPKPATQKECKQQIEIQSEILVNDQKVKTEKIDIWQKRTVGEVFEQALKRYYERKAARGC